MSTRLFPTRFDAAPERFSDEWWTPRWVFTALDATFDLDVCAPGTETFVPAADRYTLTDDGLTAEWHGTVWCNPPFSRPLEWVKRWVAHDSGILLLRADMNTVATLTAVAAADAMWLPKGRIQYVHPLKQTGQCSFPSILLARGETATAALKRASAVSGITVGVTA